MVSRSADLLILNGRVFASPYAAGADTAASQEGPRLPGEGTAVAVIGDRIAAVGTDAELLSWRGPHTDTIDARGGLILPGFDDAHIHFKIGAMALVGVQIARDASLAQIQDEIRRHAAANPNRPWVIGRGWHYSAFPGGLPTKEQLDEAVPDRPALMDAFDAHSAWANSRALEIAGVTRDTPDPTGGVIVRDPESGEATGALKEPPAIELVDRHAPLPSEDEQVAGLREAFRQYAQHGLTSGHDAWAVPGDFALFERLRSAGHLTARVRLALKIDPDEGGEWDKRLAEHETVAFPRREDEWLAGGILKAFADGVVESGTAYLLDRYADRPGRGIPNWSDEGLREIVRVAHHRGWQLKIHAIGDGAVRQVLDAYEALGEGEARSRRHCVEHIETIDSTDIARVGRLGVVASVQPYHADPAPEELAIWSRAVGPDKASRGWPLRSLRNKGAVLSFGSDWPVRPFDPFLALNAAVNRTTADGAPEGGWLPHEKLRLVEALDAYTRGSAYAAHAEQRRGAVAPGYLSDLCVLDRDLLAEGAAAIVGTHVTVTVAGGQIVHRQI